MQRAIMMSPAFLSQISVEATPHDLGTARDLADTLVANSDRGVGMAANMIGATKRIIVFKDETEGDRIVTMLNPEITESYGEYTAEEGCLSLSGTRSIQRFRRIRISFQDEKFARHTATYTGWTAQIIQHEVDHCNGILI